MAEENYLSTPDLSPLEQDVLDEYERLANNMKQVNTPREAHESTYPPPPPPRRPATRDKRVPLASRISLASNPTTDILDGLRDLERQTSMAFTLLKASVYSIVLQQEIDWGAGEAAQGPASSVMGSDSDD
ncbi:DASH complex, subunit Dad3 [Cordyceps militaris CM01]|uniref:DASH complex subunit DAD3 n=1 Tax=Cordyceps militaris (strain CM01) TaxID=983644 RepID=G3JIE0_CORMM|nr:DASH complex, subunit Dad3 [Cordyceps militaris CM01]EGX91041.1 DASH complex, subunit Dad3 [Cordyceps militaris CM01]